MIPKQIIFIFGMILLILLVCGAVAATDKGDLTINQNIISNAHHKSSTNINPESLINKKDGNPLDKGLNQYSTTYISPKKKKVLLRYYLSWDTSTNYIYQNGQPPIPYGMIGSYNFRYVQIYGVGSKEMNFNVPFKALFFNNGMTSYKVVCKISGMPPKTFFMNKSSDAYFKAKPTILQYLRVNTRNALVKNINPYDFDKGFILDNQSFSQGDKYADSLEFGGTGLDPLGQIDVKVAYSSYTFRMNWNGVAQSNGKSLIYRENKKYTEKHIFNWDMIVLDKRYNYSTIKGTTIKKYYTITIKLVSTKIISFKDKIRYNFRYKYTITTKTDLSYTNYGKTSNPIDPGANYDLSGSKPGTSQTKTGYEEVNTANPTYNIVNIWKRCAIGHNNPDNAFKTDKYKTSKGLIERTTWL